MNNNKNKNKGFSFVAALFIALFVLAGLQACGGSDSTPAPEPEPVVDADPSGYYKEGGATIKHPDGSGSDLVVTDLQAMISGNRLMMMSIEGVILYDVMITDITGNDFTGTVTIYPGMDIAPNTLPLPTLINTTVTGTITEGAQVTGNIAGNGIGSGDFSLTYSQSNATLSEIANIDNKSWTGSINSVPESTSFDFQVIAGGGVDVDIGDGPSNSLFQGCLLIGDITQIATSTLFHINLNLTSRTCAFPQIDGDYTGLATTKDSNHDTLVIMFVNGAVAGFAEWTIVP